MLTYGSGEVLQALKDFLSLLFPKKVYYSYKPCPNFLK